MVFRKINHHKCSFIVSGCHGDTDRVQFLEEAKDFALRHAGRDRERFGQMFTNGAGYRGGINFPHYY